MTNNKTVNILISVILAIITWTYVINVVNPPTSVTLKDIQVQITGLDKLEQNHLTIAGDGYYTVDVSVSAPRAEISGITAANVYASASVEGLSAGQNYISVGVKVPDNVTLDDVRSQKIQVYVDELIEEEKPVYVAFGNVTEGYEITVLNQSEENIVVRGAKSLTDMVKQVRVDYEVSGLKDGESQTQVLDAIALDAEGNIVNAVKLSSETVEITAAKFAVKTVPLKVLYVGTPGLGSKLKDASVPRKITIKGPQEQLDKVDSLEAKLINIDGITNDISYPIDVELEEGVYIAEESKNIAAKFTLIHMGDIGFSYAPEEILVQNVPTGMRYEIAEESVSATASGNLDIVKNLLAKDLQPIIDCSQCAEGSNTVALTTLYFNEDIAVNFTPETVTVILIDESKSEESENPEETEQEGDLED